MNRERIMEDYNAAQHLLGMSRYEEAAGYFNRCFEGCAAAGDSASCETLLEELSKCYECAGKYSESIETLGRLLSFVREAGPTRRRAILHHNIALLHEQLGEIASAKEHFRLSSQVAGEAGDDRGQGVSLAMLAQMFVASRQPREALEQLMRSINLLEKSNAPELEAVLEFTHALAEADDPEFAQSLARKKILDQETLRRFLDR